MELTKVEVPRRRAGQPTLAAAETAQAARDIRAGKAISPDGEFAERHHAQTEAWRWRHELSERGGLDVEHLKSATFSNNGGATYRFAIYSIAPAEAAQEDGLADTNAS